MNIACVHISDVCTLDSDTGPCEAYSYAWYFNSQSGYCEQFVYGGCPGNGNKFDSKDDCEALCSAPATEDPNSVTIPIDGGGYSFFFIY